MEQVTLNKVNENIEDLKRTILILSAAVEEIKERMLEDELELADNVVSEIKASKNAPPEDFISHEDVVAEFLE